MITLKTATPIQRVQEYWNARPCNLKHSQAKMGTKTYFDEVERRKFFVEPHILSFVDFPSVKNKKVLEIGCGMGTIAMNFARAGALKVTAVDLSEKSLDIAKQRAALYGFTEKIEFYHANAEELSKTVPIQEYDLIFSFGVIHHTPHPERVIQELRSYLSPQGQLKLMIYHRYSWKALWVLCKYCKLQFWKLSQSIATHSEAQTGCPITYTYGKKQAKKLLQSHGFHPTSLRVEHIFPYKIQEYIQYQYVKVWYFRFMPPRLFKALEHKLGWHLCITAKLAQ